MRNWDENQLTATTVGATVRLLPTRTPEFEIKIGGWPRGNARLKADIFYAGFLRGEVSFDMEFTQTINDVRDGIVDALNAYVGDEGVGPAPPIPLFNAYFGTRRNILVDVTEPASAQFKSAIIRTPVVPTATAVLIAPFEFIDVLKLPPELAC